MLGGCPPSRSFDLLVNPPAYRAARTQGLTGYRVEQIAPLAANIGVCDVLQPIMDAPHSKGSDPKWGVLAYLIAQKSEKFPFFQGVKTSR